ncbi:AEC family transporter [Microbacterium sp.]|uniref:AEC family transporter n=1 Tax=Microbacterium sp. TaxID=51671 RepID=UPI003C75D6DF
MNGVIQGFAIVGAIVATGYVLGRTEALGPQGAGVLARLSFLIGLPSLMFSTLAQGDPDDVFSTPALVSFLSTIAVISVFLAIAAVRRRPFATGLLGALSAGYVNSTNLGVPLSHYVLGSAAFVTPIMLYQLALITPVVLITLDIRRSRGTSGSWKRRLVMPLRNPVTISAVLGVLVAASGTEVPQLIIEPVVLVANMTVPVMLLAFGMSLIGLRAEPVPRESRWDVAIAIVLKVLVQPAIAIGLATWVFGLDATTVFAVAVCAALPTAQNVFIYAARYGEAEAVVRNVLLWTTIASAPVILLMSQLFV